MVDEAKKEVAKVEIAKLIDEFDKNRDYYEKTDEANIETKLIEPMFAALGWTKDDFEKREKVKRKDRRGITDYTFKLHGKSVFVLEAKKVKVEVDWDEGTWKQAISYTFSKKVSFSVLTNFKNLLIFCTDDEKAMSPFRKLKYTEYTSSRFDDLWLLSKGSFEQNSIFDRATSEGRMKKRQTIDDKLLEDLIASRKKIVESIERNYGGKYTTLEKDDIAQRIFGRLIFIRKCEDKQINFDNDGNEIEMLKEVTALPHNEAYSKLKKIFTKYDDAFNSGLFLKDVDSDVDKIEIDGKVIKELIESTYGSKDRNYIYNFEWIDADVLGNIYEQYLGHILKETTKQTRIKESHAHRKEQGIYYTPTDIVKYIVDNTLGEALKKKKPEEVMKLRVLDPACGSGSFLLKAFDVLEDYYEKNIKEKQLKFDSSGDFYSIKEQVLTNNIFGVDLDYKAVEIARLNLLLKLAEKGHRLPLLQKNIQNGNSLIDDAAIVGDKAFNWKKRFGETMNEDGFDVVIGNPPYVEARQIEQEYVNFYRDNFKSAGNRVNTFTLFIEKSINLLKDGGFFGMIVHKNSIRSNDYVKLRQFVLDKCKILKIIPLGAGVFEGVTGEMVILIFQKTSNPKERQGNIVFHGGKDSILKQNSYQKLSQKIFYEIPGNRFNVYLNEKKIKILEKIKIGNIELKEVAYTKQGIIVGDEKKYIKKTKESEKYKPVLRGRNISRYNIKYNNEYLFYVPGTKVLKRGKTPDLFEKNEKILTQHVSGRIIAVLDCNKYYTLQTINLVFSKGKISNKYLLALLNSRLINFYYDSYFNMGSEFTTAVATENLDLLPIKLVSEPQQQAIIKLVDKMLSLNKRLNEIGDKKTEERYKIEEEIKRTDAEIEELVYELYEITEEEKKIIEESLI